MRRLVAEAIEAGAVGFSTSTAPQHVGADGKLVPSLFAGWDEIAELAAPLGEAARGIVQITEGSASVEEFASLSRQIGRPVTWTALLTGVHEPGWATDVLDRTEASGGEVWPQITCRPMIMQISLADPFPLNLVSVFREVLATPRQDRLALYMDPGWRDRARLVLDDYWTRRWAQTTVAETRVHQDLLGGPTLTQMAAARGTHPLDVMVELALAEDLDTRFDVVLANNDETELTRLLNDDRAVLGLSDAGAHASQMCDACFPSYLLGYWVREQGALSLTQAVHRLTGQATRAFRLKDRGVLRPGGFADLTAFDPITIGVAGTERVWDLPGGGDRLVARSQGIEYVWVNGQPVWRHGREVEAALPGRLLRT